MIVDVRAAVPGEDFAADSGPVAADFNGDGRVTLQDVMALFEQV